MATTRRFPVSLVMIVRDEARTLARCLESVRGLVDEIVVVDTGSTDGTVRIAESYGATVTPFSWIDDFSAARNHALSLATHPWRLILDADEWIVDAVRAASVLERVTRSVPDFIGLIEIYQASSDGDLNEDVIPAELPRLLPRGVGYRGRVHEQPVPLLRLVSLPLAIGHDGYSAAALARKEGRNAALLAAEIAEHPANAYLWFQLGSEFAARGENEAAVSHFIEAFNLLHPASGEPAEGDAPPPWWHRLTLRLMLTLTALGRHEESVGVGTIDAGRWGSSADFCYVRSQALREWSASLRGQDAYAGQLVSASIALLHEVLELGESRDLAGTLPVRATVLAARQLADDYATMGDPLQAARFHTLAGTPDAGATTETPLQEATQH